MSRTWYKIYLRRFDLITLFLRVRWLQQWGHRHFPQIEDTNKTLVPSSRFQLERNIAALIPLQFLLLGALLLGGCFQLRNEEVPAALPLNENLPASWSPLEDVQAMNIDGDVATEYLLYFTYDGSNGPVGAVIYNTETDEDTVAEDPAAGRLSTSFIPYAILPSYRPGAGQGFIAEPSQRDAINTRPVTFGEGLATGTATERGPNALAILGATNYLTWVWWEPQNESYGVTQLHATDRFETAAFEPFAWDRWLSAPVPIPDIVAVHPLYDRNRLCRRFRHIMVEPTETISPSGLLRVISYHDYDLGLSFCRGVPEMPFYPEGVVLAYLLSGDMTLWDETWHDEATIEQLKTLVAQPQVLRVNDLAGYRTLPGTERIVRGDALQRGEYVVTQVCVELIMPAGYNDPQAQPVVLNDLLPSTGEAVNIDRDQGVPAMRHWLLFTLRHEPPQREPAMPDRLYIVNVQRLPASTANGAVDCRQRLTGS